MRSKTIVALVFFFHLVDPVSHAGAAHAETCGDTVTGHVILAADLVCPDSHGLLLGSGATLDCAGHTITGGGQPEQYGVYLREVSDATVHDCVVERFEVGIRLVGALSAVARNNVTRSNARYGIEVTQSSRGALIGWNDVLDNGDEGIHVSGPSDHDAGHEIVGNLFDGNDLEGIYLLNSHSNRVADNLVRNHGAAGIYLRGSDRNIIEGNRLIGDPIQLVFGSTLNLVRNNSLVGDRIKLDRASRNTVQNLSVQEQGGRPGSAYAFNRAVDNTIVASGAAGRLDHHIRLANESTNNVFLGFAIDRDLRCEVDPSSSVSVTNHSGEQLPCGPARVAFCGEAADDAPCMVSVDAPAGFFDDLQEAIDAAADGATIRVEGVCRGPVTIRKREDLTIEGVSPTQSGCPDEGPEPMSLSSSVRASDREVIKVSKSKNVEIRFLNIIDGDGSGLELKDSAAARVWCNCLARNGEEGVELDGGKGHEVIGNLIARNREDGIRLHQTEGNLLEENNVEDNGDDGIELEDDSHSNEVTGNQIRTNSEDGIDLDDSDGNRISENDVVVNGTDPRRDNGIELRKSDHNVVDRNAIRANTDALTDEIRCQRSSRDNGGSNVAPTCL